MKITENECSEALTRLLRPYFVKVDVQNVYHSINIGYSIEEDSNLLTLLIQEYFGNPPLKFEELKEDMWIWDNKLKEWRQLLEKLIVGETEGSEFYEDIYVKGTKIIRIGYHKFDWKDILFEPNRFYRKEVQE